MQIRASDNEVEISGTPAELGTLGEAIAELQTGDIRAFPATTAFKPSPYQSVLTGLRVVASSGLVEMSVTDSELIVQGDYERLSRFASRFAFPADAEDGIHRHYEWYPEHPDIAEGPLSLVVRVRH